MKQNMKEYLFDRLEGLVITDLNGVPIYKNENFRIENEKWITLTASNIDTIVETGEVEWEIADKISDMYYNVRSYLFDPKSMELPFDAPDGIAGCRERFLVHVLYDVSVYAGLFRDLSAYSAELQKLRKQLIYDNEHDALTDLYNRAKYSELEKGTFKAFNSIAVYNLDVNYLKRVNDTLGHEAGNKLITKAAESIKAVLGNNIYGFRMGGDEFLIVAGNLSHGEADLLKQNWLEALAGINQKDPEPECVIACGMSFASNSYDLKEVLEESDRLMYLDKRAIKIERGDNPDER